MSAVCEGLLVDLPASVKGLWIVDLNLICMRFRTVTFFLLHVRDCGQVFSLFVCICG